MEGENITAERLFLDIKKDIGKAESVVCHLQRLTDMLKAAGSYSMFASAFVDAFDDDSEAMIGAMTGVINVYLECLCLAVSSEYHDRATESLKNFKKTIQKNM